MLILLPLVLAPVVFVLYLFLVYVFRFRGIYRSYVELQRRGDYQGQLTLIEGLRVRGSEPPPYLLLRGMAFYQLGRLAEAEQALRRSLPMQKRPMFRMLGQDQFGRVLMAQGRWDEAANCFQECMAEFPRDTTGRTSMAELWLRRGQQAETALQEAKRVELDERARKLGITGIAKEIFEVRICRCLALQAWALARTGGGTAPVEAALQESFELCRQKAIPLQAEIHYFAGRAYGELGNTAESARQFESAVKTDPIGNFGRLAASPLAAVPSALQK